MLVNTVRYYQTRQFVHCLGDAHQFNIKFKIDGWLVGRLTSPFSTKIGYIGTSGDLVLSG